MTRAGESLEELGQLLQREAINDDGWKETFYHLNMLGLLNCMNGTVSDPIGLFWGLYAQQYHYKKDDPKLAEEVEEVVLKSLKRLYQYHKDKVTYEPDDDVISEDDFQESLESGHIIIPEKLKDLIIFLHVAAARAFRIKRKQGGGLDEVALTCLEETARTYERIRSLDRREMGISEILNRDISQTFLLSTYAVGAKALAELGRVRHREGRYSDALSYMAQAVYETSYAAVGYIDDEPYTAKVDVDRIPLAPTIPLKDRLFKGFDDISLQDIAAIFSALKASGQTDSWSQAVEDCEYLLQASELPYDFSDGDGYPVEGTVGWFKGVKNDEGHFLTWREFWAAAKAWASAQLSPNEYRKMREEDEKSASERRLKNYFFRRDWSELPERSKERLVNADINWNRPVQVALEAILSDLRIATEDICYKFIWEPLSGSKDSQDFTQSVLEKEDGRVRERPEIGDYAYVCFSSHFKSFLEKQKLHRSDIVFLTKDLPEAMDNLRKARNIAEHESKTWTRDEVGRHFLLFIGIGQRGVLPKLADIGRKLRKV